MFTLLIVITLASVSLAAAMAAIAWRAVRGERLRSATRVAILAAEIADDEVPRPGQPSFNASELAGVDLFAVEREPKARSRTPITVAAGSVIVGTVVVLAVAVLQTDRTSGAFHAVDASSASSSVISADASRADTAPIELISLTHEQSDARLTIRGVVRNPAGGLKLTHLTAVVLLFNRSGVLAGSERAALDAPALEPGAEAHFTVSVVHVSDIGRYRVSFSTEDHVVPHMDKRDGA